MQAGRRAAHSVWLRLADGSTATYVGRSSRLAFQVFGSCQLIARVFTWLAMALVAYIAAALFARPDWADVLRGTFLPSIELNPRFIGILVALLGTTISPYLFSWQASREVDEQIAMGRRD